MKRRGIGLCAVILLGSCVPSWGWTTNFSIPPSLTPPGGIAPSQAPQFILLTFDDMISSSMMDRVQQVLTNHLNPDGLPVRSTFFVTLAGETDFQSINRLFTDGHEIALHTLTHTTGTNTELASWRKEVVGNRWAIQTLAGIPKNMIHGFRAPYLDPNDALYQVLKERGFQYDTSMRESFGGYSADASSLVWPYTLDWPASPNLPDGETPDQPYPDLLEIPMWPMLNSTGSYHYYMDPLTNMDYAAVVSSLKSNFMFRYDGNRCPMPLYLHATLPQQWLSSPDHPWRMDAINDFMNWALAHSNTWAISCTDLAEWMRTPTPSDQLHTSSVFRLHAASAWPTAEVSFCTFYNQTDNWVCGPCPPAYPDTNNVFMGHGIMGGADLTILVHSQDTFYSYCSFIISNKHQQVASDWDIDFDLAAGSIYAMWDATETQTAQHVHATARTYNRQIAPGGITEVTFRVEPAGVASFTNLESALSGPARLQPALDRFESNQEQAMLAWQETDFFFQLQVCSNLPSGSWTDLPEMIAGNAWTQMNAHTDTQLFYRIKTQP